jgi:four helix bundle protein
MAGISSYRDLIAWQKGIELVKLVYRLSRQLPSDERFGLTSQIRRAVVSVPSNMAEGFGRSSRLDFLRFLDMSVGSLNEVETQIIVCGELGFMERSGVECILELSAETQRITKGLIATISKYQKNSVRENSS